MEDGVWKIGHLNADWVFRLYILLLIFEGFYGMNV